MFRHILVGVDEHDGGRDAIALSRRLLAADGQLTFAHVIAGAPHVYFGVSAEYQASERERAQALLEDVRSESGRRAELRSVESLSVGRGLHELAEREAADLLVLGSSRRGLIGRVLVGDDTLAALNGAPCAVAIAPSGYGHEPGIVRKIGVAYDGSPESRHALELARQLAGELAATLSGSQPCRSRRPASDRDRCRWASWSPS
jgi:nucleotide-binding universal stress UspA family protein